MSSMNFEKLLLVFVVLVFISCGKDKETDVCGAEYWAGTYNVVTNECKQFIDFETVVIEKRSQDSIALKYDNEKEFVVPVSGCQIKYEDSGKVNGLQVSISVESNLNGNEVNSDVRISVVGLGQQDCKVVYKKK